MDMPLPRYKQINTDITPYYHCTSRCVRQSFLCGKDVKTGINYEHRRKWFTDRLHKLTEAFAIDLCAYAVMHNHIHVVLHIAKGRAEGWSMDEVFLRWRMFYKCPPVVRFYLENRALEKEGSASNPQACSEAELNELKALSVQYRERLQSVSWFMRLLNEYIARRANKEDDCKGYFWERRFRSQAILDEKALAAVMAYVDLNPIRANIATSLNNSKHTSIHYRLNAHKARNHPKYLMLFKDQAPNIKDCKDKSPSALSLNNTAHLSFNFHDYKELLCATLTAKQTKTKREPPRFPTRLLSTLGLEQKKWHIITSRFEMLFSGPVGEPDNMTTFAEKCNRGTRPNVKNAIQYLS